MPGQDWDDIADAVALTEAIGRDDLTGAGVILRNCDHSRMTAVLAKLLAELIAQSGQGNAVCWGCFRTFAADAIRRP